MGTYVQLDGLDCEQSLSFGKPVSNGDELTLRLFSGRHEKWCDQADTWRAVQIFLLAHLNHRLIFCTDDTFEARSFGGAISIDPLLGKSR